MNLAAFESRREAVLDGIFDNGLQQHAGDKGIQRVFVDFLENLQFVGAEAGHFDIQVIVDEVEFVAQRAQKFHACAAGGARILDNLITTTARHVGIVTNQRRNRVQRVEQEMRIDLAGKRIHARLQQQLLILLQVHFNPRVVPNFDGTATAITAESNSRAAASQSLRSKENSQCAGSVGQDSIVAQIRRQRRPPAAAWPSCPARGAPDSKWIAGILRKRNGPKSQMSSLLGINWRIDAGQQSDERGHGGGQPFVISECGQADQRAAEQADDASADAGPSRTNLRE